MHTSIKMDTPCEIINITPCNPLISKCQIKVCYVGDEPNRNRSVITKDVAREMANSLPGSPIVGFYNENKEDFEEHNRSIDIVNGEFKIKDTTKPYGFVDLGAKCWFQKFKDDGVNEHEYLMTEGYIWTGQYPESQRIIQKGNNQSMELDENTLNATWTKDNNGKPKFFIINEAIISKLCILGEECEPCFEGSNITKVQFSFENSFKEQLFSMISEVKELLKEGGAQVFNELDENLQVEVEETEAEFKCGGGSGSGSSDKDKKKKEEFKKEDKKDESDKDKTEDKAEEDNSEDSKEEDTSKDSESEDKKSEEEDKEDEDKKKKNKYILEEIPEYVDLTSKFSDLETKYNELLAEKEKLESQMAPLVAFKSQAERAQKEDMINKTFYMLSDEDKKDVIENIDTYSLDTIEAKLSIICVRNKVSFAALEDEQNDVQEPTTYNLGNSSFQDESTPAWVKAVLDTAKTLN